MIEIIFRFRQVGFQCRYASANGDSGFMNGIRAARYQRMPPEQVLAFGETAICAACRQPTDGPHIGGCQPHAIRDFLEPVGIVGATASGLVEKPAADRGPMDFAGVLVLQFCKAAFAAAIADRLPLRLCHLLQCLCLPEWLFHADRCGTRRDAGQARYVS